MGVALSRAMLGGTKAYPGIEISCSGDRRFWKYAARGNGCWEWSGRRGERGYGVLKLGNQQTMAHRLSWMIHRGPIPDGLFVCHHCDNPPCVNPDHLFVGTNQDNMDDMNRKGRGFIPPPRPKLIGGDLVDIVTLYGLVRDQKALAEAFGVKQPQISRIIIRNNARLIEGDRQRKKTRLGRPVQRVEAAT